LAIRRLAIARGREPCTFRNAWGQRMKAAGAARDTAIAALALAAIVLHLLFRYVAEAPPLLARAPLLLALVAGGAPLVYDLTRKALRREFGSDLLAGISIVTAVVLGQDLAGAIVVLMLSGGTALEQYAARSASSVLEALARRMPPLAHLRRGAGTTDVALNVVAVGDLVEVYPHEICPVDGVVVAGRGAMDESYLTGEPFVMSKTPGSPVLSGAVNGERALTIRATRLAVDSRYATIMKVMRASEQRRPRLRRLADQLGAVYTPVALMVAAAAWIASGEPVRFLAVLVIATPCPLLIAIPVAVIGSISLAAKRGIIVKDPAVLEQIDACRTIIFDKTGTLTYGKPELTEQLCPSGANTANTLRLAASLERYSKHPLSAAIQAAARGAGLSLLDAEEIAERPFEGLLGTVAGMRVRITNRKYLAAELPAVAEQLPPVTGGLECVVVVDEAYAATYRFRDTPRAESSSFVSHLGPKHLLDRTVLLSGDRESEVRYLAEEVGITELHAGQSPEEKVAIVRAETTRAKTIFVGDGINDAPALTAATVGIAFGQESDITAEAAGAVIMDSSLTRVDEFFHISRRMRQIALQSAVGGMALSVAGMAAAAAGLLPPVHGAIGQELIDLAAVLNALRAAWAGGELTDF
jgi:heavy metal translocating P-type ATPase